MQLAPSVLIAKLKSDCPLLKQVSGSADFAAAKTLLKNKMPAAFVVPLAEQASPNSSATMQVSQKVVQQFGVFIAVSNLRDATGEHAVSDLFSVRQQILQKLVGWTPAGAVSFIEFGGGSLMDMDDQVVWWQDNFTLDIYIRNP
ncbi:MAG: hypothetical protein RL018_1714 [Pseudomonadota bacterium]|jgi:hypothetical protein